MHGEGDRQILENHAARMLENGFNVAEMAKKVLLISPPRSERLITTVVCLAIAIF